MKPEVLQPAQNLANIEQLYRGKAHAYLLVGNQGAGKGYVAQLAASKWLGVKPQKLSSHPTFMLIDGKNESISIAQVRQIQSFLQLKTLGAQPIRRVIILEQAENMTDEAQNALLKTLEEPPEDTRLILTTTDVLTVKATVSSRTQKIHIRSVSQEQAISYFTELGHMERDVKEAYSMSQGAVGLLAAILDETGNHSLHKNLVEVKAILSKTPYERMLLVDSIVKQKDVLADLLVALKLIAQEGLKRSIQSQTDHTRWQNILRQVNQSQYDYQCNSNNKLLLTDLFISL